MSTEVGAAVETVRAQAQALLERVNDLIAVVKEPEIQQALIEVRDGLQKVLDKFDNTGMRDIDSLIDIVAELRTITDKLSPALQNPAGAHEHRDRHRGQHRRGSCQTRCSCRKA